MRFHAVNSTGTTMHVRIDRGAKDVLLVTISKRKVSDNRRPIGEYVLATNTPLYLPLLDGNGNFTVTNPDKLTIHVAPQSQGNIELRIIGFVN